MKSFYVFCIFAILSAAMGMEIPDELKEMANMVHEQCIGESGSNDADIEATKKGIFPADNQKLKCYLKCLYSNMGAITDDGEFDAEAFGSILPESMAVVLTPLIEKCKGVTGSDGCELAYNFNMCFYNADPVNYLVI